MFGIAIIFVPAFDVELYRSVLDKRKLDLQNAVDLISWPLIRINLKILNYVCFRLAACSCSRNVFFFW